MKKTLIAAGIVFLLISCNFVNSIDPTRNNTISTRVSEQLTASPIVLPTETVEQPAETYTPSPAPTETETATPTASLTPTLSPNDPRSRLGNPTWKETFDKSNQNFDQSEDEHKRFKYEDGALVLTAKNPNWASWTMSYPKPKNFYLEATFKTDSCSGEDRYGLVFRAPSFEDGYFFGITCDGRYYLKIYSQKGELIPLTANPAINSGPNQINRVGVLAQNDRFAFYLNGKLLQETKESTFPEAGMFGAYIVGANTINFTVRMDEIAFWNQ
jgi:hypothetical protein